ncbi:MULTISPECIES: hypothetical protein [unclassified Yoonia]|uniref:hypothetical protein n=1 Tax=unclassified Yoonia TaxID=2629118 RepID=UPI002AFE07E6|nr:MULTISPECIES: hypothetical protein [unclassified Yoonia]
MSDMTPSNKVDDLVASVRHLVANEPNGTSRKMPSLDRLLLTPALRVDGPKQDDTADPETTRTVAAAHPSDVDDNSADTDLATDADIADLAALDGAETSRSPADDPAPDATATDLETQIIADVVTQDIPGQFGDAALRDAVLQVLHEELAGEMGERITRNVRKLVRREINRVLASREFD